MPKLNSFWLRAINPVGSGFFQPHWRSKKMSCRFLVASNCRMDSWSLGTAQSGITGRRSIGSGVFGRAPHVYFVSLYSGTNILRLSGNKLAELCTDDVPGADPSNCNPLCNPSTHMIYSPQHHCVLDLIVWGVLTLNSFVTRKKIERS